MWQYVEFTMEHLVPLAAGGLTQSDNLALACFPCNRRKSDRRGFVDPEVGEMHRLFNPRRDAWNDHFAWSADGLRILGATSVGRATVEALDLNRERHVRVRAADLSLGRHPPPGDRRLR